jgi:hypothetical protein
MMFGYDIYYAWQMLGVTQRQRAWAVHGYLARVLHQLVSIVKGFKPVVLDRGKGMLASCVRVFAVSGSD